MKERRVYTAEFKREAVRLSEQQGVSVAQVAQELGVSDYSLYKWRKQARQSDELAFPGNGKVALTAEQQENVRLKRELEFNLYPLHNWCYVRLYALGLARGSTRAQSP